MLSMVYFTTVRDWCVAKCNTPYNSPASAWNQDGESKRNVALGH